MKLVTANENFLNYCEFEKGLSNSLKKDFLIIVLKVMAMR